MQIGLLSIIRHALHELRLRLLRFTPLSTIFQLYRRSHFYCWKNPEGVPGENHRHDASHGQTITWFCIEYTSPWAGFEWFENLYFAYALMLNNPAMAAIVDLRSTQQRQTIYNHPMNIHESIELSQVYNFWDCCLSLTLRSSVINEIKIDTKLL